MKFFKLLIFVFITLLLTTSCVQEVVFDNSGNVIENEQPISLNQLLSSYDLWYIDINRKQGNASVPFIQKAFTISFLNGKIYANNNLTDVGRKGNGFGIEVGNYSTYNETMIAHHRNGRTDFNIIQLSENEIRIDDINQNVSYFLVGYQRNEFDYDKLFYDNISYFLQEYTVWEKTIVRGGNANIFDEENYIQFTSENSTTFRTSKDNPRIPLNYIRWDFIGGYKVTNYDNTQRIKHLTLFYDGHDKEDFDLTVIDYRTIRLHHIRSQTTYDFIGKGTINYLRKEVVDIQQSNRKNTKKAHS